MNIPWIITNLLNLGQRKVENVMNFDLTLSNKIEKVKQLDHLLLSVSYF